MTFHYSYNKYNEVKMQGALRAIDGETEGSMWVREGSPRKWHKETWGLTGISLVGVEWGDWKGLEGKEWSMQKASGKMIYWR